MGAKSSAAVSSATPAFHHSRRPIHGKTNRIGTSFSDVATPTQTGAVRYRIVHTNKATTSGWTLPNMAVSARKANSSAPRVIDAGVALRRTGQAAKADAASMQSDQTCATTSSGKRVSGIHRTANHGAYR